MKTSENGITRIGGYRAALYTVPTRSTVVGYGLRQEPGSSLSYGAAPVATSSFTFSQRAYCVLPSVTHTAQFVRRTQPINRLTQPDPTNLKGLR